MTRRAAALVAILAAAACGRETAPAPALSPETDPTLTVGVAADVTGIYPRGRDESYTSALLSNAYEGLTRFDHDLRPVPALAERWESTDDRTWLFTLRPGARFSDGTPVTAPDVVSSLRNAMALPGMSHVLAAMSEVREAAGGRVEVRTRTPAPTLLTLLTQAFVIPQRSWADRAAAPPSTGPYFVSSWTPGRELVLQRNPHHPRRPPWASLRFLVIPTLRQRLDALRDGRIQLADAVSPGSPVAGARLVSRPGLRVLFLALRADVAPFSDVEVRRAVDGAIDRQELIARALDGHGTPATQLVPSTVSGFEPAIAPAAPERARVRKLLRDRGPLRLDGPTNRYAGGDRILEELARQLREAGLDITVNPTDKEQFFAGLGSPGQQMFLFGWSCDGADAGNALAALLHSPRAHGLGFENSQGFADARLDRLIEQADAAPTPGERRALLSEALRRVDELKPIVPLVVQHETVAIADGVDWDPPVDMALRLAEARRSGR